MVAIARLLVGTWHVFDHLRGMIVTPSEYPGPSPGFDRMGLSAIAGGGMTVDFYFALFDYIRSLINKK